MKKYIAIAMLLTLGAGVSNAQQTEESAKKTKKAWEIGVGATGYNFNRVIFADFNAAESGYTMNMKLRHVLYGGNIYVAKELSKHFYLDLQGNVGKYIDMNDWMYTGGLGLQWRLGEYFGSKYIDPYLRVGGNYMYKDFIINYTGNPFDDTKWNMENNQNKSGADRHNMFNVSAGVGLNMWLNDRFGIGMQADYLVMPYENVANTFQGTARLMWRIGGASKKTVVPTPVVKYVDVEKIVEKIVEVEKIVRDTVVVEDIQLKNAFELISNINFEFDKDVIMPAYYDNIVKLAQILKQDTSKRYLITGFTDIRGSQKYNLDLSARRAAAVVKALSDEGVPAEMLKSTSVGSKIAHAKYDTPHSLREGDRKVTIEMISNMEYWNYLD